MHARSGLTTEYLSEEWMQCIEACEREARALGMEAWVYDENGWPSGFAGGKLLEEEGNRDKYILTQVGAYDEAATVSYLLTEEQLVRVSEGTAGLTSDTYLNLYIHTSASTADILNPEVVDKFLALTHEQYKKRFGETFSQRLEGFFTDEPQYYRWHTPYTDMMARYWKEQFGGDILDELGLLFVEKEGYRRFRYRYWKGMQSLMLHNFAEKIYSWCEDNHVKLTGHYVEESRLGWQMTCCGGIMPFYEYEHIPGIDWLGCNSEDVLPAKQVESVAAQTGRKQVLTESFGCCGWDVSPSDLRRIAGFQYVNGVNRMCQHLVPYSERGSRKYDHPAHYSQVNPWVQEDFKTFNDYYTRLGYLLGEGEKRVNVAMLHPIRSAYFAYNREAEEDGYGIGELEEQLHDACRTLSRRGIDFHFLDETLLAKYGYVKEGRIGCGQCGYDYLVLPSLVTMDVTTKVLVERFAAQGGKLLLLGTKPTYVEAEECSYDFLQSNVTLEEICAAQPYRVCNYDTKIYSTYRRLEGREFLYVMNSSEEKSYTQTFDCGAHVKSFVRVNLAGDIPEEGCRGDVWADDDSKAGSAGFGKIVPLTVTLKPGEDALLFLSPKEAPKGKEKPVYPLRFSQAEVIVKENILPVDMIRYSKDGVDFSKPWPCPALFQKLLKERYQGEIFFRYEFDVEVLPKKLWLRTEKSNDLAAWINDSVLAAPSPSEEVYVNVYDVTESVHVGRNHYTVKVDWFEQEAVYYALFGENVTESLKNCLVYDTELQPIELIGSFGVYPRNGYVADRDPRFVRGEDFFIGAMPKCVETEPATEGFPFLAGEMILKKKMMFDTADVVLRVEGEYHLAWVKINGVLAGKLYFEKELDISHVVKAGENEVEVRFILSNRNRLGPHHLTTDKNDSVWPTSFTMEGNWQEDSCPVYHGDYDIKKFYGD